MKKLFCLILASLLILTASCSSGGREQPNVTQPTEPELDFSDTTLVVNDAFAGTDFSTGVGMLDYSALREETGIRFRSTDYLMDETRLKLLAGDTDVDIYIVGAGEIPYIVESGLYTTFDSEQISGYLNQCHEIVQEYSMVNDKTAFLPIQLSTHAVFVPKSAIEETGVTADDIEYLDGYLEFARSYQGDRIAYTNSSSIFNYLESQYEIYYCDFEKKDANFETPLYMHIYEEIWGGWQRPEGGTGATIGFEHNITGDYSNNSEHALCSFGIYLDCEIYTDDTLNSDQNVYLTRGSTDFFEKWRAFPIPKISEKVTTNVISGASFAFINPYSENKEAALKVLETIASDYFRYAGYYTKYSLQFADKSLYPDYFHTDSEIFNDFFQIIDDMSFSIYTFYSPRTDINDYQAGKLTLEEAVAEYQRQVDIWLNE